MGIFDAVAAALAKYRAHPIWKAKFEADVSENGFVSKWIFKVRWGSFEGKIKNDREAAERNNVREYWIGTVTYNRTRTKGSLEWYAKRSEAEDWVRQAIDDWDNENRGNKV